MRQEMKRAMKYGMAAAARVVGLSVTPAVAATAEKAPASASSNTGEAAGLVCANPAVGWVRFWENADCGGVPESFYQCRTYTFGYLDNRVSSYMDRQTGGAFARVYNSSGTQVFRTYPDTGVRNLATWENDRSATVRVC
jgi:hypothetical protein